MADAPRKLNLPLLTEPVVETPQTITLITAQVMAESGKTSLRDVLRLDPSVSQHADEDSGQGDVIQIRGFSAKNDLYRDGQLDLGRYYRDPFDLEIVEVLTGPSSVLFGRGSTGGAINSVSKTPGLQARMGGTLSGGDDSFGRATLDLNAPLSASAAVRINAVYQYSRIAGRHEVFGRHSGVAPTLALGLGGRTQLTLGLVQGSQSGRPDYGVPWIDIASSDRISYPADGVWSNYYGFKDDFSRLHSDIATAELVHQAPSGWKLRNQLRYAWYDRSFRATEPAVGPLIAPGVSFSAVTVTRVLRGVTSSETLLDDQASITGKLVRDGVTHKLAFGAEIGRQTSKPTTFKYSGASGTSLATPNETSLFTGTVAKKSEVRFSADTASAFAGDTLEFGPFEVEGVARIDRFAAHYQNSVPSLVVLEHTDVEPSFRAAFIYKPAPAGRFYAMWGTSFDPSAEGLSLSTSNRDLVPMRNQTLEAGVKWTLGASLLVSAAAFRTVQENYRETSPLDPTVTTIAGTARSQGVEFLAQGRITPAWRVLAGYTYLDAQIVASPNADVGQPLQNAPRHSLRLFSAYDLTRDLTAGGEVNAASGRAPSSFADALGYRQRVPGYTVASVFAGYAIRPGVSVQLNVQNLFNARYYDGLDDNHVNVGAGRSVRLTLSVKG